MSVNNYINHVVLVLDASYSMDRHVSNLIRVVDTQIEYLAKRSEELNQETRVSIYEFADRVSCLVYDMDVLRLPSIERLYETHGQTALIDATLKSLEDLAQTATLYGDHAFLTYVLTDGQENRSRNRPFRLKEKLSQLPSNWTVAALVPDESGRRYSIDVGFPQDNVAIWNANSASGVIEVGQTIKDATENFMQARSKGNFVGTRSLFSTGLEAVNAQTVHQTLTPLAKGAYDIFPVHHDAPIRDYIYSRGVPYEIGKGFYQLTKTENIQPQKQIAIREKASGQVFWGDAARDLLGLPRNMQVRVKPNLNPEYDVFVQSTSVNRKLIANTDVLVLR
jgi:hypothetical protein